VATKTALVIGGTGPTAPPLALGLEKRNSAVTLLHWPSGLVAGGYRRSFQYRLRRAPGLWQVLCRTRHPKRPGQHADLMVSIPSVQPYLRGTNPQTSRSVCHFPGASDVVLTLGSNPEDGKC
jgi:hypothetical protein